MSNVFVSIFSPVYSARAVRIAPNCRLTAVQAGVCSLLNTHSTPVSTQLETSLRVVRDIRRTIDP